MDSISGGVPLHSAEHESRSPALDAADSHESIAGAESRGLMPGSEDPEKVIAFLRLHLATLYTVGLGVGILRAVGGGVEALFSHTPESLCDCADIPIATARRILSARVAGAATKEYERARREGVAILCAPRWSLPPLRDEHEQPVVLFARGDWRRVAQRHAHLRGGSWPTVGVVGSREPSPYALRSAQRFTSFLARHGVVIVSGLARGIDRQAHAACVESGGCTIAVLGSGLGRVYPAENQPLARRIEDDSAGVIVTPFLFTAPPRGFHFPLRNAVISALSTLVFVVEAGERSGSLITADHALRQGKPIYTLPNRVDDRRAAGSLRLLQDGAAVALAPSDLVSALLLEEGGRVSDGARFRLVGAVTRGGDSSEDRVGLGIRIDGPFGAQLRLLFRDEEAWTCDALATRLGVQGGELLAELGRLEMQGILRRAPDGAYVLA